MQEFDISGPYFVSIGDEESLKLFLEKNQFISKSNFFVDDKKDFSAYNQLGFGNIGDHKDNVSDIVKSLKAPNMSPQRWLTYLSSASKLAPISKDAKFTDFITGGGEKGKEKIEGVLRLGGTFVLDETKLVYVYEDKVPGDHPIVDEVLEQVKAL